MLKQAKETRETDEYKNLDTYDKQVANDRISEDFTFISSQMMDSLNNGRRIIGELVSYYDKNAKQENNPGSYITEETMNSVEEVVATLASHFVNLYKFRDDPEFLDLSTSDRIDFFKQKILDKIFEGTEQQSNDIIGAILVIKDSFSKERVSRDLLKSLDLI